TNRRLRISKLRMRKTSIGMDIRPRIATETKWVSANLSATHEGDDFDLIAGLQWRVVFVRAEEPAVQFDGDLVGGEIVLRDERRDVEVIGDLAVFPVDLHEHERRVSFSRLACEPCVRARPAKRGSQASRLNGGAIYLASWRLRAS